MTMQHRAVKIFLAAILHIIYCNMAMAGGCARGAAIVPACHKSDNAASFCGGRSEVSRCDTLIRSAGDHGECDTTESRSYSESTLIIFYEDANAKRRLVRATRKMHCETIYDYINFNAVAVRIPEDSEIMAVAERIRKIRGVLTVERDRILHLDRD